MRLADADLLPPPLRAELLGRGPGRPEPGTVTGPERTVDAAIAASARRAPQDTAVVCGGESWTYERLERRADAFAARLRAAGAA